MYGFFVRYVSSEETVLSILGEDGSLIATRSVQIGKISFVESLTSEMIALSHDVDLYHHDIFAIGVVVDPIATLEWETETYFKQSLEASFGFTAVVGEEENAVKSKLLALAL